MIQTSPLLALRYNLFCRNTRIWGSKTQALCLHLVLAQGQQFLIISYFLTCQYLIHITWESLPKVCLSPSQVLAAVYTSSLFSCLIQSFQPRPSYHSNCSSLPLVPCWTWSLNWEDHFLLIVTQMILAAISPLCNVFWTPLYFRETFPFYFKISLFTHPRPVFH